MLMSIADKILLRKRALIETVNNELKNIAQIEHLKHRSFNHFIAYVLISYSSILFLLKEKTPLILTLSMTENLDYFILYRTHVIYLHVGNISLLMILMI